MKNTKIKVLVEKLNSDKTLLGIEDDSRITLINKIKEDIEGDILEHTVLAHCINCFGSRDIRVTQLKSEYGEWDMVVCKDDEMEVYRIVNSKEVVSDQYHSLIDDKMGKFGENLFRGNIIRRVVLYNGLTMQVKVDECIVDYINIEEFLLSIKI